MSLRARVARLASLLAQRRGDVPSTSLAALSDAELDDAIAIYLQRGDELIPEYVNGDNFRLFSSLRPTTIDSPKGRSKASSPLRRPVSHLSIPHARK